MKEVEIEEGNKLIADFMGAVYDGRKYWTYPDGRKLVHSPDYKTQMKYHTSWDWLMPVVEKINTIAVDNYGEVYVIIAPTGTMVMYGSKDVLLDIQATYLNQVLISHTYPAVVQFIKWYNQNKKLTP